MTRLRHAVRDALRGRTHEHVEQRVSERLAQRRHAETLRWVDRRTLWRSRNDRVVQMLHPGQIADERSRWTDAARRASTKRSRPEFVISAPNLRNFSFCIAGDPGDGDASQYAVALAIATKTAGTPFLVLLSDVVYPAGDINEYVDKLYVPYKDYPGVIYGVPGNHDWYDGLNGFMFHFCGLDPLARPRYRSSSIGWRAWLAQRLFRRASAPWRQEMIALRGTREPWKSGRSVGPTDGSGLGTDDIRLPRQPGPYFAIETPSLLLVAIDTGVGGTIDREQAEWLLDVAEAYDQPKILLTGKPIYVDGRYEPCEIEPLVFKSENAEPVAGVTKHPWRNGREYTSVDEIVLDSRFGFRAVIGGDVHNYQRYTIETSDDPSRRIEYIVSGGGGAYLSTTHAIDKVDVKDVPATVLPIREDDGEDNRFRCYPLRGDAIALYTHFARNRIPGYVTLALMLLAFSAAVASFVLAPHALDALTFHALDDVWERRARVVAAASMLPPFYAALLAQGELVRAAVMGLGGLIAAATLYTYRDQPPYVVATCLVAVAVLVLLFFRLLERQRRPESSRWWWVVPPLSVSIATALAIAWLAKHLGPFGDARLGLFVALVGLSAATLTFERDAGVGIRRTPLHFLWIMLAGAVVVLVSAYVDLPRWAEIAVWVALFIGSVAAWLALGFLLSRNRFVRWPVALVAIALLAVVCIGTIFTNEFLDRQMAAGFVVALGLVPLAYLLFSGALTMGMQARRDDPIDADLACKWIGTRLALTPARERARGLELPGRLWRRWVPFIAKDLNPVLRSVSAFRAIYNLPRAATQGPFRDFFSELFDFDEPPLFKNFLRVTVEDGRVDVECFGVSGWDEDLADLPLEDRVTLA